MNITYKDWENKLVTEDTRDFYLDDFNMCLPSLDGNCGLCYFSGTEYFNSFPNKEEILEVILSTAEFEGNSAVIFSFNPSDRKDYHQKEAIQMLKQYPGATVCVAERKPGYSLFIITVPVVPVL